MKTIADRLIDLRESKDWTKTKVAKKLGLSSVSTYANWEYGLRDPHAEMIAEIAALYDVSTDYIITGKVNIVDNSKADIGKELESFLLRLDDTEKENFLFFGHPLNEKQKEILANSIEIGMEMVKKKIDK